ncbi:acyl-CoA dehydrogenase family protein [Candidatus Entotheonella palauensis]|uniref:acyl-CoA dehydrogenase family protein n=1 Tax=Candidatus Entotheonella palauensis TaxID=93172 RepID=UPI000B7EAAB6|nr:acyl-CoA dehydrogenase family protein [Candidatus Entotheonella palauensis]
MNFEFSEAQNLLRQQAQSFLREHASPAQVRAVLDDEVPFDEALWRAIVDLGWTATTIPEVHGGLGLSYLELCVLAEELGRSLAPTPFSSSVYLATEAILAYGTETQKTQYLPRLADGEIIGCYAVAEGHGQVAPGRLETRVEHGMMHGAKLPVADGDVADLAIVLTHHHGRYASMYLVDLHGDGVTRTPIETLDPTRSHAHVTFDGAPAALLGNADAGWDQHMALCDRAAVLYAFEQVGGAQAALDMARAYAMERYAFGRPIASFQALKHKMADMYIAATLARSNCYYGAWALDANAPELPVAAAMARVSATQAFHECAKENIQIHGGMGFTWEFDCHMYYRRAKLLAVNLGSLHRWQELLVTRLEASPELASTPAEVS